MNSLNSAQTWGLDSIRDWDMTQGARFCIRFLLACAVAFTALELSPDYFYYLVNRLNAVLAGHLLSIAGNTPKVNGLIIVLDGFPAQVIGECSAVFLSVLPLAFIFAYPSNWWQKTIGWIIGISLLFSINLIRIALLVYTGANVPQWFEWIHLYLGQTVMVLTVSAISLGWIRWLPIAGNTQFTIWRFSRCLLLSLPLFWIMGWVSIAYIHSLYFILSSVFGWFGAAIHIPDNPHGYAEVFHCFNLVTFTSLFWGFNMRQNLQRWSRWVCGLLLIVLTHLIFKLLSVLFFQFHMHWLMVVINAAIQINLFILPFGLWLFLERDMIYGASDIIGRQNTAKMPAPAIG
jgi:exosortase/archaeosortase family protein